MKKILSLTFASFMLISCAGSGSNYQPIVDMEGSPAAQPKITCVEVAADGVTCLKTTYTPGRNYNADLNSCRGIATQARPVENAATQGVIGAIVGAAGGAAIGAILGRPGTGAAIGAVGGAIGGTARGGMGGVERQEQIVRDCMRGRGWNAF